MANDVPSHILSADRPTYRLASKARRGSSKLGTERIEMPNKKVVVFLLLNRQDKLGRMGVCCAYRESANRTDRRS